MNMLFYLEIAYSIPGWRHGEEAVALCDASYSPDGDAVIVEVGAFLGRSTILLAGARKLRGSGKVHCFDPFDCSGDAYSVPVYQQILASAGGRSLREHFDRNINRADLSDWVQVHECRAADGAIDWQRPVDVLLLDGDQSPGGARDAYEAWIPHLKSGGTLFLGNSAPRDDYAETHDGNWLIANTELAFPRFLDIRQVGWAMMATKA
jgi:hypothetical protein